MKTALDWYCKEINYLKINYTIGNINENEYLIKQVQIYQQAKQMMKQQIIDTWCNALDLNAFEYAEQYYNKTFKQQDK
jgi:hypothetical protein